MELKYLVVLAAVSLAAAQEDACVGEVMSCFSEAEMAGVTKLFGGEDQQWDPAEFTAFCDSLSVRRPCLMEKQEGVCAGAENADMMEQLIYVYPVSQCLATPAEVNEYRECTEVLESVAACDPDYSILAMQDVDPPLDCDTMGARLDCIAAAVEADCGKPASDFMRNWFTVLLWQKYRGAMQCDVFSLVTEFGEEEDEEEIIAEPEEEIEPEGEAEEELPEEESEDEEETVEDEEPENEEEAEAESEDAVVVVADATASSSLPPAAAGTTAPAPVEDTPAPVVEEAEEPAPEAEEEAEEEDEGETKVVDDKADEKDPEMGAVVDASDENCVCPSSAASAALSVLAALICVMTSWHTAEMLLKL